MLGWSRLYALNRTCRIGCSALDPEPNSVCAPAVAGRATITTTTLSAARPLTLDLNLIPFPSKVNPHNFDQNCWVRVPGFSAKSMELMNFGAERGWTASGGRYMLLSINLVNLPEFSRLSRHISIPSCGGAAMRRCPRCSATPGMEG